MEDSDYIVVGRWSPSREVAKFVQIRGELVEEIGPPIGEGYYARIYRITK